MKICSFCKKEKTHDCFSSDKSRKDGKQRVCKECHKEYNKKYEKTDKCQNYRKEYRSTEHYKQISLKRYHTYRHTEKYKRIQKEYENRPESKFYKKLRNKNRVHMKRSLSGDKSSSSFLFNLIIIQDNKCVYCNYYFNNDFHIEHLHPLSKGGSNLIYNIALSCPNCNIKKKDKLLHEWLKLCNIDVDQFIFYLILRNLLYFYNMNNLMLKNIKE